MTLVLATWLIMTVLPVSHFPGKNKEKSRTLKVYSSDGLVLRAFTAADVDSGFIPSQTDDF